MAKDSKVGKIRAQLVEMWKRTTTYDDKQEIYLNGENNLYPNEIELAVMNSPTAKRASVIMSKFISGSGVVNDLAVNSRKKYNLSDVVRMVSDDLSIQYGAFIHVGYGLNDNGDIVPNKLDTLDYTRCRIDKEDDNDYLGMIIYKDWETKKNHFTFNTKNKGEKEIKYYPFNSNPAIVFKQMQADSPNVEDTGDEIEYLENLIKNYKGQVYYLNLTPRFKYAVSPFDCVYNDCDTEYRISLYGNTMTRSGPLGKTAILTQGLEDEQSKKVKEDIQGWLGAENSQSIYHMDVENAEDLEQIFKVVQIESQYDDDMLTNTEKRVRRNILGAANNIPEGLVYSNETALFGQSGEAYVQMKKFYEEQTQEERKILEKTLTMLGFPCEIIKLTDTLTEETENDTDNPAGL